ncbi:unnamed protein product, partial [Prorocentrum cordatum]
VLSLAGADASTMARVLLPAVLLAGVLRAGSATCDTDTGGHCNLFACHPSRGPTYCSVSGDFACTCLPGHCSEGGRCVRDPELPEHCDVDQSSESTCSFLKACDGAAEVCTGRMYGVCMCQERKKASARTRPPGSAPTPRLAHPARSQPRSSRARPPTRCRAARPRVSSLPSLPPELAPLLCSPRSRTGFGSARR